MAEITSASTPPAGSGPGPQPPPPASRRPSDPTPTPVPIDRGTAPGAGARLKTDRGTTQIADVVVAKIARLATREVPGVFAMGRGLARAIAGVRSRIAGSAPAASTMGVSVEVGERQAAVDIDIVAEYGYNLVEVTESVRANVIERVEGMTGLEVVEVNIVVDDLHMEDDEAEAGPSRVE